ncbi:MAG: hypothetical protein JXB36_03285 [Gammaproteobacteria bacterium]|nr:hypothetical protein [Gammaproteobacteria bacterium]
MHVRHLIPALFLVAACAWAQPPEAQTPEAQTPEPLQPARQPSPAPTEAPVGLRDPGQKSVRMVRAIEPPVIDGVLDEDVWQSAALVDDLHQVNPVEYAEPFERTEIYLLYDDDALYVGARLYDTDPDLITANVMRQGGNITGDDTLFVTIDPFNTRRGGYFFGLNPHSVRFDGVYRNVSEFYADWDGIWQAAAGRFDAGWIAEYRIPYKTLSFDPNTDTWGLNFSRSVQRKNEDIAWSTRNRRWDPSVAGRAIGFENINQGLGLDIVPTASYSEARAFDPGSDDSDFRPSLDVFYKLTPGLNAALTVNTDFSATEVDDRQVNLTRFNLFFPEKRDFFLRESDIFEFGRIGAQNGNGSISNAERQNGRPFFSRRIGLSPTGDVVDLDVGGKISGRVGPWEIGALSIRQDEFGNVAADNLSVVRAKANIVGESTVGIIATEGDPTSDLENSTAGVDFLYRNSRLAGGHTLEAYGWYQQSDTERRDPDDLDGGDGFGGGDYGGQGSAFGAGVSVPSNAGIRGGVEFRRFERNFNPALGFVSRRNVEDVSGHVAYTHRPSGGYFQSIYAGLDWQRIEVIDGGLQSQSIGVTPIELTNRTGDVLFIRSNIEKEVLDRPFEISPGIVIPVGEYSFHDLGIEIQGSGFRKVSGRIAYIDGDFYGGTRDRIFGAFTWTPSPRFRTNIGYNINYVELPQGDFTTRLFSTSLDVVFSSTLSWVNLIQYDNVSDTIGINSRLHWIPEAGREIYFVINHNLQDFDEDDRFHSQFSDATVKFSYTFRF